MKKKLIITACVIAVLFISLLVLPFAFKGQIMNLVKQEANKMLNGRVEFSDVSISFIRNFPNVSLIINDLSIVGVEDFAIDTLVSSKKISAVVNLKSFFGDAAYEIKRITIENAAVNAHILPDGRPNWDIMKSDSAKIEEKIDTSAMNFNLKLHKIELNNANIIYNDEQGAMKAVLGKVNFSTSGDFTADSSLLKTSLSIDNLNFTMDNVTFLSNAEFDFSANINANLNALRFELRENKTQLNAIELSLNGWIQMLETEGFDMDISLNTEKVDFKSILSLVPSIYNDSFKDLTATGKAILMAAAKGKMAGESYPTFDLKLLIENGSFRYPALPKSVDDIVVALEVSNKTDKLETMLIDLSKFSFNIGGNLFSLKATVHQALTDPDIDAFAKGKLDLAMVKDFYPLDKEMNLNGVFDADLKLNGKMSYYEKSQFDKFKFAGNLNISALHLKMPALFNEVTVPTAKMEFNNNYVNLTTLQAGIGKNDFTASGKLENFIAYMFNDKTLSGNLILTSNYLNISDFMSNTEEVAETKNSDPMTIIEVPKNINFTLQATVKQLIYDKMNFTDARGVLKVSDGVVAFQNLGLQGFGGSVNVNGHYSTQNPQKPDVKMDLNLSNVSFVKVFEQIETVQKFAPIFEKATGNFSTKMSLVTTLKDDMMPDLATLLANGSLSTASVALKEIPALTALSQALKKPALANTAIKNLLLLFEIKDGKIATKPFDIALGDVKLNLGGDAGLDKTLAYSGTAKLPDNLNLGKFSTVGFKIGGTFSKPTISLDLKETLNAVVDEAKQKVKEEVTKKVEDVKNQAREKAVEEALKQADKLRAEAKSAGQKLVDEAAAQGQKLINEANKTSNPIAKAAAVKAAEMSATKLKDEAQKQADKFYNEADNKGNELVEKAKQL